MRSGALQRKLTNILLIPQNIRQTLSEITPIVSITIPTYNRFSLLKETLDELTKQIDENKLHNEIEIVVSDNASKDWTKRVVEDLIGKNKYRIIYNVNPENLGVIRNILKLVELSNGKFWMFYGDDDKLPDGSLIKLVNCFKANLDLPAFMFRQSINVNSAFKELNNIDMLSITDTAENYFYYIGNAGVFAANTALVKKALSIQSESLLSTCWPQTELFFLAVHLSGNDKIYNSKIASSFSYGNNLIYANSYYLFETMLYSLVRSALSINKVINTHFAKYAIKSIFGIQFFAVFKYRVLEQYMFLDFPDEKKQFRKTLAEALETIPVQYAKEILYFNRLLAKPEWVIKVWLYRNYIRRSLNRLTNVPFLNKMKIISPLGYAAIIKEERSLKKKHYISKGKGITEGSGYF